MVTEENSDKGIFIGCCFKVLAVAGLRREFRVRACYCFDGCLNWLVTPHGSCNFEGEGLTAKFMMHYKNTFHDFL